MDLQRAFDEGFEAVKSYVDRSMNALEKRVEEMSAQIEKLLSQPQPVSVKSILIDRENHLIVTFSNGDASDLGLVVGKNGEDGNPGIDGLGVKGLFRGEGGVLVATMSDGTVKELGQFVGKDGENGKPGKDGTDGVGFDDLSVGYDGEKTVTLSFSKGDQIKEFSFVLPVVIDRGVFTEGKEYQPGDGVTWAGSFWIAQNNTSDKPDSYIKSWRLAVKKGRDGKDGMMKSEPSREPIRVGLPKGGE